jgi:hypothetical protein
MDPYLETRWGDVHVRLCGLISATLQPRLPGGLRARAEQRVLLEGEDEKGLLPQRYATDIAVVEHSTGQSHPISGGGSIAVAEPLVLRMLPAETRERWVEIIDTASGNKVITVIEILSLGNKAPGKLNRRYRRKLRRYVNAGVNVVEIDLLRSRRERLQIKRDDLPPEKRTPYLTCICRPDDDPDVWLVYPMPLRSPLPTIPIPCRQTDDDVPLSLQPLIDQIYLEGGHDDIDYKGPLRESLSAEDAAWAAELVAAARP